MPRRAPRQFDTVHTNEGRVMCDEPARRLARPTAEATSF